MRKHGSKQKKVRRSFVLMISFCFPVLLLVDIIKLF
jgi:hypothetical protein